MLRDQFQEAGPGQSIGKFFLQERFVIRKFSAQAGRYLPSQRVIFLIHRMNPPEDHHAADVQCPVAFFAESLVTDAVAYLIMLPDSVKLVAGFRAMEIQPAVLFTIPVVQRNSLRVIVVSEHG